MVRMQCRCVVELPCFNSKQGGCGSRSLPAKSLPGRSPILPARVQPPITSFPALGSSRPSHPSLLLDPAAHHILPCSWIQPPIISFPALGSSRPSHPSLLLDPAAHHPPITPLPAGVVPPINPCKGAAAHHSLPGFGRKACASVWECSTWPSAALDPIPCDEPSTPEQPPQLSTLASRQCYTHP